MAKVEGGETGVCCRRRRYLQAVDVGGRSDGGDDGSVPADTRRNGTEKRPRLPERITTRTSGVYRWDRRIRHRARIRTLRCT